MKRILTLALTATLAFATVTPVIAIEGDGFTAPVTNETATVAVEVVTTSPIVVSPANDPNVVCVIVNDSVVDAKDTVEIIDGTSYVSFWPVVKALYPDATLTRSAYGSVLTVSSASLNMEISLGATYLVANGRYLTLDRAVTGVGDTLLLPARTLGAIVGADVSWDNIGKNVVFTVNSNGPIASADVAYNAEDLYWLSHIIYAEAGNQPLEGKIAVGNVVLNRVASSQFPNSVKSVVYQSGQFTPVANGTIYLEPNAESVKAAKLCLDGANTVGNALFFINPKTSRSSWVARNRTLLTVIAEHAFYA